MNKYENLPKHEFRVSDELAFLAQRISNPENYNPDKLTEKYIASPAFASLIGQKNITDTITKHLAETYVASIMEISPEIDLNRKQLASWIGPHYLPVFNESTYGAEICHDSDNKSHRHVIEIDELGLIAKNQLPFVIEVELGNSNKNSKTRINETFSDNRIDLLQKIFNGVKSLGYILVVDPSNVAIENSPLQSQFVKNGGLIVPFPVSRGELLSLAANIKRTYSSAVERT